MAKRTLYATKDMRDPIYRTRMLKAGEPIELSGPDARLYLHLGVVTKQKPRAKPGPDAVTTVEPTPAPAPTTRTQLDHDNDGRVGGSKKGEASTRRRGAARKRAKKSA